MPDITAVAALVAALAAIIAPVITTIITSKQAIKLKKLELFDSSLSASVSDLTKGYAGLLTSHGNLTYYWTFHSAAYRVMSQIPDKSIQKKLITLLKKIRDNDANMSLEINELFDSVILDISNYLSNR